MAVRHSVDETTLSVQLSDAHPAANFVPVDNAVFDHQSLLFPFIKIGLLNKLSFCQGAQRAFCNCFDDSAEGMILIDDLLPVLVHR
jgi:hypothetical protein